MFMKMSGSIRRTGVNSCRFLASRQSIPPLGLARRDSSPGPEAHHFGPGFLPPLAPPEALSMFPGPFPVKANIPAWLRWKSRLGTARSNFNE